MEIASFKLIKCLFSMTDFVRREKLGDRRGRELNGKKQERI